MDELELHVRIVADFDSSQNQILGHSFAATKYGRDRREMERGNG